MLDLISAFIRSLFYDPHMENVENLDMNASDVSDETSASQIPPPRKYLFDTPQNARHSTRVICDEEGLSLSHSVQVGNRWYMLKDIVCACIDVESGFRNYYQDGRPVKNLNLDANGKLKSTDWGICQINDYWHIGPNREFPSVEYVLENPEKIVRWMVQMARVGKLKLWVSYTSGAYRKFLPQ